MGGRWDALSHSIRAGVEREIRGTPAVIRALQVYCLRFRFHVKN